MSIIRESVFRDSDVPIPYNYQLYGLCSQRIVELLHNIEYRFAQSAPIAFSPTTRSFSARVGEIKATATAATTSSINRSYISLLYCESDILYIHILYIKLIFPSPPPFVSACAGLESLNNRAKQFSGARDFPNICTSITRRRTQYR